MRTLRLNDNNLQGELRAPLFARLSNLNVLILAHNRLSGRMENILTPSMKALRELDLSYNSFTGHVPWTTLGTYNSLEHIKFAYNKNLEGQIEEFERVCFLENLTVLSIGQTSVRGRVPSAITRLKKLRVLDFEELQLTGNISFLVELPQLSYVHLKNNRLVGHLPADFGHRLIYLENLHLGNNLLHGDFPDSFDKAVNITVIDVTSNNFTGTIPSSVLKLEKLQYLDVSFNRFGSISSNLTLPSIQFLVLAGNKFNTTAQGLFTTLVPIIEDQRTSLRVLDVSSCGLVGEAPQLIWGFPKLMVLNISRNELIGQIPRPPTDIYYLMIADLSYNNFSGPLPDELAKLRSIRELDVRYNPLLKSHQLPQFALKDDNNRNREFEHDHFTCPTIQFDNANNGILYINSTYYGRKYCLCDPYFYGENGLCRACLQGGTCKGDNMISKLVIEPNYYPSPSPDNAMSLVQCNLYYQDTFRCNPEGNCSCWSSSNDTTTICDSRCLCAFHSTGRLCSQCEDGYYRHFDICLPCSKSNETPVFVVVILAVILILLSVWFAEKILCLRSNPLLRKTFQIAGFVFQALLVLGLGLAQIIPAYAAEFYLLFVVLAVLNHYLGWGSSIRVFSIILFVHLQMLDSLRVSFHWTDCSSCSLAGLMHDCYIDKVTRVVNFHLSGLACSFPWLVTPIGRLYSILLAPLGLALLVYLCYVIEVHIRKRASNSTERDAKEKVRKLGYKCKSVVIFILKVFYFPVATDAIKAVPLPSNCRKEPNDSVDYMRAYPSISCESHTYVHLAVLAIVAIIIYVLGVPLFFFWLIHREHDRIPTDQTVNEAHDRLLPATETTTDQATINGARETTTESSTRYSTDQATSVNGARETTTEESTRYATDQATSVNGTIATETTTEGRTPHEEFTWLQGLCSPFKPRYHYTAVGFMFRNCFVAFILSVFTRSQADFQSVLVTIVFVGSIAYVVYAKPYRNKTPWKLENVADVGSFLVIFVTYNSVSSRRNDVLSMTATVVFVINVAFVLAVCIAVVGQLIYTRKVARKTWHETQGKRLKSSKRKRRKLQFKCRVPVLKSRRRNKDGIRRVLKEKFKFAKINASKISNGKRQLREHIYNKETQK